MLKSWYLSPQGISAERCFLISARLFVVLHNCSFSIETGFDMAKESNMNLNNACCCSKPMRPHRLVSCYTRLKKEQLTHSLSLTHRNPQGSLMSCNTFCVGAYAQALNMQCHRSNHGDCLDYRLTLFYFDPISLLGFESRQSVID